MTDDAKTRYEEDKEYYDLLMQIVQHAVAPVNTVTRWYVSISTVVFGFMFLTLFLVYKESQSKATLKDVEDKFERIERDYVNKLQYYQVEEDEHTILKEGFKNPDHIDYIMDQINDNTAKYFGLKYGTSREGEKK